MKSLLPNKDTKLLRISLEEEKNEYLFVIITFTKTIFSITN